MSRLLKYLLLLSALAGDFAAASSGVQSFVSGSLERIERSRAGTPFVLLMWSVDCPPCVGELDLLAAQRKRHPELELILVSTDDPSNRQRVETMLVKHGLGGVESWIFGDSNHQRLRYEIDSSWYGELPRSYFYDANHQRAALSGAIQEAHISAWLNTIQP